MGASLVNPKTQPFLPPLSTFTTSNYENTNFFYDHNNKELSFKLPEENPYKAQLKQVYPIRIDEDQLTSEMRCVIQQYTNEHYLKTNLNLLSNFDIDWDYTNKLRSIIRGLYQLDLRDVYYRGLNLSDIEINYYKQKVDKCYYTNSFLSFTTEKQLAFQGNSLIVLHTISKHRLNMANVWKWSTYPSEMEAILSIASKLKILKINQEDNRWIIEVELVGND
jgi:hypothetical protein